MGESYDYNQVVKLVNGLGSKSSLKRWRNKAEELTGHHFRIEQVRLHAHSTQRIPFFTDEEVEKFQIVADNIGTLGLDQAVVKAFGDGDGRTPLEKLRDELMAEIAKGQDEIHDLQVKLGQTNYKLTQLQERATLLEQRGHRGLFGRL